MPKQEVGLFNETLFTTDCVYNGNIRSLNRVKVTSKIEIKMSHIKSPALGHSMYNQIP